MNGCAATCHMVPCAEIVPAGAGRTSDWVLPEICTTSPPGRRTPGASQVPDASHQRCRRKVLQRALFARAIATGPCDAVRNCEPWLRAREPRAGRVAYGFVRASLAQAGRTAVQHCRDCITSFGNTTPAHCKQLSCNSNTAQASIRRASTGRRADTRQPPH